MKKIFALFLALSLLFSVSGCACVFKTGSTDKQNYIHYDYWIFYEGNPLFEDLIAPFKNPEYSSQEELLDSYEKEEIGRFVFRDNDGEAWAWSSDKCVPILRPPTGFFVKASSPMRVLIPVEPQYESNCYEIITSGVYYELHPLSCSPSKEEDVCFCKEKICIVLACAAEMTVSGVKSKPGYWLFVQSTASLGTSLAAIQTVSTAEYVPPEILATEGANVLSPFCLPMIPFRLLRILLKELVKVAFAFGIGWLFVWFVKRRKKSTPTK